MKTSKQKFKVGDRVTLTKEGLRRLRKPWGRRQANCGFVVGVARSPFSVLIRVDRNKCASSYWIGFWKKK